MIPASVTLYLRLPGTILLQPETTVSPQEPALDCKARIFTTAHRVPAHNSMRRTFTFSVELINSQTAGVPSAEGPKPQTLSSIVYSLSFGYTDASISFFVAKFFCKDLAISQETALFSLADHYNPYAPPTTRYLKIRRKSGTYSGQTPFFPTCLRIVRICSGGADWSESIRLAIS
ncbi:MAG: hypothetical protein ACYTAO_04570 [Planctomycetota bacterium]|jgi:hypothetical protein